LAELELSGPGVALRLCQERGAVRAAAAPADVLAAPAPGVFLPSHPLQGAPLAPAGTVLAAGDPVGLLRIGALLLPVPAPRRAMAGATLAEAGQAVGYGDPLIELHPLAE
ncbi:MAG: hypothetical protein KGQ40_06985, partial [Rhodospirillales bacterium]|nr:hypothetical protein [Rhodospirillales bacterium]